MLQLDPRPLQTLTFATLILSSQAGVYLLRERGHFWNTRPSRFLIGSSVAGLGVTALLALGGILMPAIRPSLLLGDRSHRHPLFQLSGLGEGLAVCAAEPALTCAPPVGVVSAEDVVNKLGIGKGRGLCCR